jgi:prepilin-type N-terminal cleavage/methylation domain-containing protein
MAERLSQARRALAGEGGFTMIEVVVAAAIAGIALIGVLGAFDGSRNLIVKAERVETATHIGEQELERTITRTYATVATASPLPTKSSDPLNPRYHVNVAGTGYAWDQSGANPAATFVPASGTQAACTNWTDGAAPNRLTGQVCRFITWYDDPSIPGATDAKRVTIAVSVNGGKDKPVTFTSIVWDRRAA